MRHHSDTALPNLGAHVAPLGGTAVAPLIELLHDRAEIVADSAPIGAYVAERAQLQLDRWQLKRSTLPAGQLGYEADAKAAAGLLRRPEELPWDSWSAPMSLRDVEPDVLLQLRRDDPSWSSAPLWEFSREGEKASNDGGEE